MEIEIGFLSTIRDNDVIGVSMKEICEFEAFHSNADEKSDVHYALHKARVEENVRNAYYIGLIIKKNGNYYLPKELKKIQKRRPCQFWKEVKRIVDEKPRRKIMIKNGRNHKKNHKNRKYS